MSPFSGEDRSLRKSIETFWRSLYGLMDLHGMASAGFPVKKEWSPGVIVITELGAHIAKWHRNIITEELPSIGRFALQLWTDRKSREKIVVCMEEKCPGKYALGFFIPVPSGQDFSTMAQDAFRRIGAVGQPMNATEEGFRLAA
jgi:hypothetical protein